MPNDVDSLIRRPEKVAHMHDALVAPLDRTIHQITFAFALLNAGGSKAARMAISTSSSIKTDALRLQRTLFVPVFAFLSAIF
ncbi:MAG: hypothetical protein MUF81_13140 [Verrucomicrobia bacterium]|jgi:hypothetical protein|nr:hypothetical protein [Verrucomicrobiota bacterium]